MKRLLKPLFILVLIFISYGILNAQERKVKKAFSYLSDQKFEECLKISKEIELEYPDLPLCYFINYKYYSSFSNPSFSLIKSFENITKVGLILEKNNSKEAWCENFNLCSNKISLFKDSIAYLALQDLIKDKDKSKQKFINYLNFYKNTTSYLKCIDYYSEWSYSIIFKTQLIENFENFIRDFPDTKETFLAKEKIQELEFESCFKRNDISCLETFVKKNPNSKYENEVRIKIEELAYEACLKINENPCLEMYIQKYPNSKFVFEAKNRIEKNDYENAIISDNKVLLTSYLIKYPNSKYLNLIKDKIKDLNSEYIIVNGTGINKEDAINKCLIHSIELISSTYINSEVYTSNEQLIKESIKSITIGEIINYSILNENQTSEGNYEITIKSKVRTDTLSNFFKSKGLEIIFDNKSFKNKIKNQKIREQQESTIMYKLIGELAESFQTSFDFSISANNPIKTDFTILNWNVPLNVVVKPNQNLKLNYNLMINLLEQLSIPENELNDYIVYKKKYFPITIINKNNDHKTYNLRNKTSLEYIDFFFNNYFNYITSFKINCGIDSLNGLNIESNLHDKSKYIYLKDPTWTLNYPNITKTDATINIRNIEKFEVKIDWVKPNITHVIESKSYNEKKNIEGITLKNLISYDTLATITLPHFLKFEDLKKISTYKISSNGKFFKFLNNGMVFGFNNKFQFNILLNNFDTKNDTVSKNIIHHSDNDIQFIKKYLFEQIYYIPFFKISLATVNCCDVNVDYALSDMLLKRGAGFYNCDFNNVIFITK
jgi:hypothetical protein